ncbi:metallophosphoesterase [Candidatus Woesearchaeota archaeon]|nr:metallophosphoesterase [Candidatus Woesearchaeota archaeon]
MVKFSHLADIHLGSWKEPKLRELSERSFAEAIKSSIAHSVDFVLISGDLFNTSLPPIESLKLAVAELKKLKDAGMPVYTIAGSHDFSPSGKTMLEVLEEAELVVNVCKGEIVEGKLKLRFTTDKKTGAKITGMIGKKGMLEKKYYEELITENLENEKGFKIFMFHTALSELKPEELEQMEAAPLSLLPAGFDYYAGGHVHIVKEASIGRHRNVVYPGPVFPNSFSELEKLGSGGFYIYDDGRLRHEKIEIHPVVSININCEHKTPQQATEAMTDEISGKSFKDAIVLLRLFGRLETGKTSEINTAKVIEMLQEKGAYFVMKNTGKLATKEFEEVKIKADTAEEAEALVVQEHVGQVKSLQLTPEEEKELVHNLMLLLDKAKEEGEKQSDYDSRIISEAEKAFQKQVTD